MSSTITKGALVAYYANSEQPRTIVFQLNPESIQRRILPSRLKSGSSQPVEVRERISFVLAVASRLGDGYFVQDENGDSHGILPFLSAIELLAYSGNVFKETTATSGNGIFSGLVNFLKGLFGSSSKHSLPHVSLVLDSQRVVPVNIKSIHITEQEFDASLQPIRATVKIVMDALNERESKRHVPTKEIYEHYLRLKVSLANSNAPPDF